MTGGEGVGIQNWGCSSTAGPAELLLSTRTKQNSDSFPAKPVTMPTPQLESVVSSLLQCSVLCGVLWACSTLYQFHPDCHIYGTYDYHLIQGSNVSCSGKKKSCWSLEPASKSPTSVRTALQVLRPPHHGVTCFDLWLHSTPDGMELDWLLLPWNLSLSLPEPAQSGPSAQPEPTPHWLPFSPHGLLWLQGIRVS